MKDFEKVSETFSDRKTYLKHELSTASLQSSTGKVILNIKLFYAYRYCYYRAVVYNYNYNYNDMQYNKYCYIACHYNCNCEPVAISVE